MLRKIRKLPYQKLTTVEDLPISVNTWVQKLLRDAPADPLLAWNHEEGLLLGKILVPRRNKPWHWAFFTVLMTALAILAYERWKILGYSPETVAYTTVFILTGLLFFSILMPRYSPAIASFLRTTTSVIFSFLLMIFSLNPTRSDGALTTYLAVFFTLMASVPVVALVSFLARIYTVRQLSYQQSLTSLRAALPLIIEYLNHSKEDRAGSSRRANFRSQKYRSQIW